jgi:hypothetical protein
VHEKELDILDVADEEGLVAGRHHVAGLLVGAIADLETETAVDTLAGVLVFPRRVSRENS